MRRWARAAVRGLCVAVVTATGGLLVWASAPAALGWQPHVVLTGSMAPRIAPGDVVVVAPDGAPRPGQVVAFRQPGTGRVVVHRVRQVRDDGSLLTRGDANASTDSDPVPREAVVGVARLRVPWVGSGVVWTAQGRWGLLATSAALAVGLLSLAVGAQDVRTPQHRAA